MKQMGLFDHTEQTPATEAPTMPMRSLQGSVSSPKNDRKLYSPLGMALASPMTMTQPARANGLSAEREETLILTALHAEEGKVFREAVEVLLTDDERELIESAELLSMPLQACCVFDTIVRRVTLRFADLIGWNPQAIADIVEPAKQLSPKMRCIVLNINSRDLRGKVAFKVSQPESIGEQFPSSVINALAATKHYWRAMAYLEPIYHNGKLLRSQSEVRRFRCRPIDPILVGTIGCGPLNYGYKLSRAWEQGTSKRRERVRKVKKISFVLAHWD